MVTKTNTKTKQNRAETERRLIDAAAGVNRGNIYPYFGSRRELLRAAINRRFEAVAKLRDTFRRRVLRTHS